MNARITRILLPVLTIIVGIIGARAIIAAKPEAKRQRPPEVIPLVETMEARRGEHVYMVHAQGSVEARTASALVAEVAGRVLSVEERFVEGGFFDEGDVLVTLDDRDYRANFAQAQADVAQARLTVEREEEEARVAAEEWRRFDRPGAPTSLVLREPQLAQARAALAAVEARLEKAQRDLDRTRLRAPYTGRVRQKLADVGDFLQPGAPAAQIYAVDFAEVRVPLPDEDLAYLDLPFGLRGRELERGPSAIVRGRFAGRDHEWEGFVHRTEGEIDPRSRMVHVVVRVADPYGEAAAASGVPLAVGMFVDVGLMGRRGDEVFVWPRKALLEGGHVAIVGDGGKLSLREVEILRATREEVVIGGGLNDGDLIVLTRLDAMIDGMSVRVMQAVGSPE
jgi:RND family efflux transporter MFP subunit